MLDGAILCTMDVVGLYSNITPGEGAASLVFEKIVITNLWMES